MQNNKNTILLGKNGKRNLGKQKRVQNICYFMITDQISKNNVKVIYCPTDNMTSDFMTKNLQTQLS